MATTYNIYQNGKKIKNTASKSLLVKSLTTNTAYQFQVSAVVGGKETPKSGSITVKTK